MTKGGALAGFCKTGIITAFEGTLSVLRRSRDGLPWGLPADNFPQEAACKKSGHMLPS